MAGFNPLSMCDHYRVFTPSEADLVSYITLSDGFDGDYVIYHLQLN